MSQEPIPVYVVQPVVPVVPVPPKNRAATASLVLGIITVALCQFLAGMFVSWATGLVALGLGIGGIVTAKKLGGLNKKRAIWGTCLSFAPLVFGFVWFYRIATAG